MILPSSLVFVFALAVVVSARPAAAAEDAITVTSVTDEGFAAFKFKPPRDVHYQKKGGGFSSLVSDDGSGWISWNPSTGNAGDFRGIPNMVHPSDGGYFHPGRTTATTQLVSQSTSKVVIESTSSDG